MRKFKEEDWGVTPSKGYMGAEKEGDDDFGGGTVRPPPTKPVKP